jgi:hypothetical protein
MGKSYGSLWRQSCFAACEAHYCFSLASPQVRPPPLLVYAALQILKVFGSRDLMASADSESESSMHRNCWQKLILSIGFVVLADP